jgi:glycerol transport system ATP-binding protein
MNVLPCTLDDGFPRFAGHRIEIAHPLTAPSGGPTLEIGIRPEFVSFSDDGIPVDIVKVNDAGRHSVVEVRHDDASIKILAAEGETLPAENARIRFDPAHTQVYADGWMINGEAGQ